MSDMRMPLVAFNRLHLGRPPFAAFNAFTSDDLPLSTRAHRSVQQSAPVSLRVADAAVPHLKRRRVGVSAPCFGSDTMQNITCFGVDAQDDQDDQDNISTVDYQHSTPVIDVGDDSSTDAVDQVALVALAALPYVAERCFCDKLSLVQLSRTTSMAHDDLASARRRVIAPLSVLGGAMLQPSTRSTGCAGCGVTNCSLCRQGLCAAATQWTWTHMKKQLTCVGTRVLSFLDYNGAVLVGLATSQTQLFLERNVEETLFGPPVPRADIAIDQASLMSMLGMFAAQAARDEALEASTLALGVEPDPFYGLDDQWRPPQPLDLDWAVDPELMYLAAGGHDDEADRADHPATMDHIAALLDRLHIVDVQFADP